MEPTYKGHEFEALKLRYEDQVELLRYLTGLDMRIFTGVITVQFALGAWFSIHDIRSVWVAVGILILDLVFVALAGKLLCNQFKRRKEVIQTVKNLNQALGFDQTGVYLADKAINAKSTTRTWHRWYIIGMIVAVLGLSVILFSPDEKEEPTQQSPRGDSVDAAPQE